MLQLRRFACEGLETGCVTDEAHPRFSFAFESDRQGASLREVVLEVNGWTWRGTDQVAVRYDGTPLSPCTVYRARVRATDDAGESAEGTLEFETGLLGGSWEAEWISDAAYHFGEKGVAPLPMVFRHSFTLGGEVRRARVYATALGIYDISLNGQRVGERYFAPGFTSYGSTLQYQTYDVTDQLGASNELVVTVAGGWAVGPFSYTRKNRVTADRQALLLEVRVEYADGTTQTLGTGEDWQVTEDGPCRMACFYDGETYDARVSLDNVTWRPATREALRVSPVLVAEDGAPVRAHEVMRPVSCTKVGDELIYDFGQNFAGVVDLAVDGHEGQTITVRHAEILKPDGTLNTDFLRTAKATLTYVCREGRQEFSPHLTYMGFRYVAVSGVDEGDIKICAHALYSDLRTTGEFGCSDKRLNRLQQNIVWSSKSNLMDIPTDCPQRDERMGWTGDIAVFAPTACYNFDMGRFLRKWLRDLRSEQYRTGGIPVTVPAQGFGFPTTIPPMAVDFWGDACVLVPWALYQAEGDVEVLRENFDTMKRYVDACRFWAGFGVGDHRYIWHTPAVLHFGDWVAPDVPKMGQWQARSKWTATASLQHTSALVARIAKILDEKDAAEKYGSLSKRVSRAYRNVFTDGHGRLKQEFQTAYVLPIQFGMLEGDELHAAVKRLSQLVEQGGYRIGTGFPGTPYILFALADNGEKDAAFRMLECTSCPSWLYEVVHGATTIWERWDGLDENGNCPIGDDGTDIMISYNHYASGAVGDFFYCRVAGLEPLEPGYRRSRVQPLVGGDLRSAHGAVETPYGRLASSWKLDGTSFSLGVVVPLGTTCEVVLPDGSAHEVGCGSYSFACEVEGAR